MRDSSPTLDAKDSEKDASTAPEKRDTYDFYTLTGGALADADFDHSELDSSDLPK